MWNIPPEKRITDEALAELEAKHGDDRLVVFAPAALSRRGKKPVKGAVEFECVFKPPSEDEWHLFKINSGDSVSSDTKAEAQRNLAVLTVIHVTGGSEPKMAFAELLKRYPAIPEGVAKALGTVAGFDVSVTEKK